MTTSRCSHIAPTTGTQCSHLVGDATPKCAAGHHNTHFQSAALAGPRVVAVGASPVRDVVDLLNPSPPSPVEVDESRETSELAIPQIDNAPLDVGPAGTSVEAPAETAEIDAHAVLEQIHGILTSNPDGAGADELMEIANALTATGRWYVP